MENISEEQQYVINQVKNGRNVQVDACAGSGKSTTILSTASVLQDKTFLLITYNKSLRKEIKEKVENLELSNITVHTYHSLAVSVYNPDAYIDKTMRILIANDDPPNTHISHDIVVLDEVQDMTFLYFRFVIKYIRDMGKPIQLMVLGDFMQGLYEFKGADIRFLTSAQEIWSPFPLLTNSNFIKCSLKTSYRVTNQIADFVNEAMLETNRLHACRDGEPVCYIRRRIYELQRIVVHNIKKLMDGGAKPSDFFILGGSVKGPNSNIRKIENALVEAGIPCHVPMMETSEHIDEDVIKGKVVFSSFHTSKGRQRPYVFVIGFDHSYFKTIARNMDPCICPNTLYVATTRASERLFLLETDEYPSDRPCKFLKLSHIEMKMKPYIDFRGITQTLFEIENLGKKNKETILRCNPTDLVKFISENVLEEITPILDKVFVSIHETTNEIQLPFMIQTRSGYHEDVSDLNGIAISSILYDYIRSIYNEDYETSVLYDMIQQSIKHIKPNKHEYLRTIVEGLNPVCETIEDYLYMANVFEAIQEKLYFKLKQIDKEEYNWLSEDVLKQCKKRIVDVLQNEIDKGEPRTEETIIDYCEDFANEKITELLKPHFPNNYKFMFNARVDLITEETLWELKCTSDITTEHLIQTVVYAWIMRTIDNSFSKKIKIFNIRTGQVLELIADKPTLDNIMVSILKGKYCEQEVLSIDDFIQECHKYSSA
jgi:hypothetical protein